LSVMWGARKMWHRLRELGEAVQDEVWMVLDGDLHVRRESFGISPRQDEARRLPVLLFELPE